MVGCARPICLCRSAAHMPSVLSSEHKPLRASRRRISRRTGSEMARNLRLRPSLAAFIDDDQSITGLNRPASAFQDRVITVSLQPRARGFRLFGIAERADLDVEEFIAGDGDDEHGVLL